MMVSCLNYAVNFSAILCAFYKGFHRMLVNLNNFFYDYVKFSLCSKRYGGERNVRISITGTKYICISFQQYHFPINSLSCDARKANANFEKNYRQHLYLLHQCF